MGLKFIIYSPAPILSLFEKNSPDKLNTYDEVWGRYLRPANGVKSKGRVAQTSSSLGIKFLKSANGGKSKFLDRADINAAWREAAAG